MSLKFCPKCGGELPKDEDFCPFCGADLKERKSMETKIAPSTRETVVSTKVPSAIPEERGKPKKKVEASDQYADFLHRLAAWLIDLVMLIVICFVVAIFLNRLGWPLIFIFVLIVFLYYWILEVVNNGQTVGKMALKLRTVDAKTLDAATAVNYLINNLLKCNPLLILDLFLGILVNINDPMKRKRIMQNASGTIVVRTVKK